MSQYNPLSSSIPNVPFEQPKALFRFGEQTLWSTQFISTTTSLANQTFRLFTTPVGQFGQGFSAGALTISETNLKEGGRVPSGIAYDVFGIASQVLLHSGTQDTSSLLKLSTPVLRSTNLLVSSTQVFFAGISLKRLLTSAQCLLREPVVEPSVQ